MVSGIIAGSDGRLGLSHEKRKKTRKNITDP